VLVLAGVAFAVSQSGGGGSASSDTTSLTPEEQATSVARQVATLSFALDPNTIDTLQDQLRPLATGSFLDDVNSSGSELVSSVKSSSLRSTVHQVTVSTRSFDGNEGVFLVEVDASVSLDSSSTTATIRSLVTVSRAGSTFLVSKVVDCSSSSFDSLASSSSC
jgi:hypothetical protein